MTGNKIEEYERINLEDYIQTGEGGTSLTYNHKDGKTLAKLFMPGMGLSTPKPIGRHHLPPR